MKIGMRTIKTAIAAGLSMALANSLSLLYAPAAGIIAILSVGNTKKNSLNTALGRLISLAIATGISFLVFHLLGFNAFAFGIFVLLFIPVAVKLKLTDGIVVNSVLVTHYLIEKSFHGQLILNEFLLMGIGIGFALLFNAYMPDMEKNLREDQVKIEKSFKNLLKEMGETLNKDQQFPLRSTCQELTEFIRVGQQNAVTHKENHWLKERVYFEEYFSMRRSQARLLQDMIRLSENFWVEEELIEDFRKLLFFTAENFSEQNDGSENLKRIDDLYQDYRKKSLPKNRDEFENRALLFQFLQTFKNFIEIKAEFSAQITSKQN